MCNMLYQLKIASPHGYSSNCNESPPLQKMDIN